LPTISEAIVVATVAAGGGASAVVDLYTRRVPNPLTIGIAAVGVTMAATHVSGVSVAGAFAGFALGLLLMLPGHVIGATGAGDVKLFAAVGTLLGPSRIGMAFLYTAMAGGALAMVIALQRRRFGATMERTAALVCTGGANVAEIERPSADNRFAYAPAIAVGAIVAALGV
jgi:Flp pilus assembly protein protease CpaA